MSGSSRRMAVVGMFDGVHLGHRSLLATLCAEAVDRGLTPMALTFSNHPLQLIRPAVAPRLLSTPGEKALLLDECGVEPEIVPFDEEMRLTSAAGFLAMLRQRYGVEALMMGFNNRFGHEAPESFEGYVELGRSMGVEVLRAPEFEIERLGHPVSSSEIRRALGECRPEEAADMLGRPYSLSGEVVHGRALGRTLGFPTANLLTEECKLIPGAGAYAARAVTTEGNRYPAMVNIGHRPTVAADGSLPSIEAHLIDLPEGTDLYGRGLTLELHRYLRPERRFSSLDALAAQLAADRRATIAFSESL